MPKLFTTEDIEKDNKPAQGWRRKIKEAVEQLKAAGFTNPTEEQVRDFFDLGGYYWVTRGIRNELLHPGSILSDEGKIGDLETKSFSDRNSRPISGQPTEKSYQYYDRDHNVTVNAPAGTYFEVYGNGAVRRIEGVLEQPGDPKLAPILSDAEGGIAGSGAGGTGGSFTPPTLTSAYKDSQAYKDLPEELKKLVDTSFATFAVGTEQDFVKLNNAIKQAQAIVDPFFAAQLALTRASIVDQVAKITKNYEFGERATKRIRDELLQDIGLRLDELGLEEQSTLARTLRGLDNKVLDLRDAAAAKGTTFGTGRFTLSEDIGQAQVEAADVIQSTRRQANFERERLSLRAARGDTQAQEDLAKLEAEKGFDLQAVGRQAESLLGTSGATQVAQGAPALAGVNFVGGVLGDVEVARQKAFASELGTFFDAQKLNANLIPSY